MNKLQLTGENNHTEFKRELTDSLEKEVIAFLNSKDGGVIYIGVNKNLSVIGVNDIDGVQLKVKDRIKHNISPSTMGFLMLLLKNLRANL